MTKRNTWNHRKLSDFIKPMTIPPLYSTAKTGQIVTSEPQKTTSEPANMCDNPGYEYFPDEHPNVKETPTGAEHSEPLPELGNLPEHMPTGTRVIIGKHNLELVRAGKDDEDTPCYRLRYQINLVGNQVFDVDTLNAMGARLEGSNPCT